MAESANTGLPEDALYDASAAVNDVLEQSGLHALLAKVKYAVGCTSGFGDFTYRKPNRRQPQGGALLPAHVKPIPRVTVIVDTSGSMGQSDLALALGVIGNSLRSLPDPEACGYWRAIPPWPVPEYLSARADRTQWRRRNRHRRVDRGGSGRAARPQGDSGCHRRLHRLAANTCWPAGSRLPHASRDGRQRAEVD